jgi:dolichol kinase
MSVIIGECALLFSSTVYAAVRLYHVISQHEKGVLGPHHQLSQTVSASDRTGIESVGTDVSMSLAPPILLACAFASTMYVLFILPNLRSRNLHKKLGANNTSTASCTASSSASSADTGAKSAAADVDRKTTHSKSAAAGCTVDSGISPMVHSTNRTSSPFRLSIDSGILLGALYLPLTFTSQLVALPTPISSGVRPLLWLSMTFSFLTLAFHPVARRMELDIDVPLFSRVITVLHIPRLSVFEWLLQISIHALIIVGMSWASHIDIRTFLVAVIFYYWISTNFPALFFKSFTFGESVCVSTMFALVATNTLLDTLQRLNHTVAVWTDVQFTETALYHSHLIPPALMGSSDAVLLVSQCLMVGGAGLGLVLGPVFRKVYTAVQKKDAKTLHNNWWSISSVRQFYLLAAFIVFGMVYPWVWWTIRMEPCSWLFGRFMFSRPAEIPGVASEAWPWPSHATRLVICMYWIAVLVGGIKLISATEYDVSSAPTQKRRFRVPNVVVRKYYHLLVVLMFVPGIVLDPRFVAFAFAAVLFIFILAEYLRVFRVPPFGETINGFMQRFLDQNDTGIVILSHTYLLIGCALPVWVHLAALESTSSQLSDYIPALAGVIVLGIGDSAASLCGSLCGKIHWFNTKKTLEGTIAGVLSILLSVKLFDYLLFTQAVFHLTTPFILATTAACLLESFTDQLDNLFLPLYYYSMLLLLI